MKFEISSIPTNIKDSMIKKNIWTNDCLVSISKLKLLNLIHYNFDDEIQLGQMIVLDKVASSVMSIFQDLLSIKFPIYSLNLIDEFNGNDELSMEANNSSCFNFRKIQGSDLLSMHSYGLAIDINPIQNPFIQQGRIFPIQAQNFLKRDYVRKGMVEPIVNIFNKYGFSVWGGNWTEPIDYHHFQVPRSQIQELIY